MAAVSVNIVITGMFKLFSGAGLHKVIPRQSSHTAQQDLIKNCNFLSEETYSVLLGNVIINKSIFSSIVYTR